jgi:molybdenum cofactor cytidylyltransferase
VSSPVGVILAAGFATRMGRPKQLLPYGDGTTVLGSVIGAALASRLERVILVLGAHGAEVLAAVDTEAVEVLHNPEPERGNLSSLLVATAESGASPVLLLMGDMPGVESTVIDAHIDAWAESPAWMRITEYADGRGHPFVLSRDFVAGLSDLEGPKPLWALTRTPAAEALPYAGPMPVDVDTPEDYGEALARHADD